VKGVGDKPDRLGPSGDPPWRCWIPLSPLCRPSRDHMARAPRTTVRRCQESTRHQNGPPLFQPCGVEQLLSIGFDLSANKVADLRVPCSYEKLPTDILPPASLHKLTPSCLFRTVGCLVEPRREGWNLEGPLKLFVAGIIHHKFGHNLTTPAVANPQTIFSVSPPRRMSIDARPLLWSCHHSA